MFINELSFDNPIEIEIICGDAEREIRYNTKVDSINKNVLRAVTPEHLKVMDDIVAIYVYYKTEGKCNRWICEILGFERSNHLTLIVLSCNQKSENINSRTAFRVPCGYDIEYEFDDLKFKGHLKNLSSTGVGLLSNKEHEVGDTISLAVKDLGYELEIEGQVVRREEQRRSIFKFLYGIKMEEEDEELTSYIFKKQVEIIRKRKKLD